jgi:hypothetical protein
MITNFDKFYQAIKDSDYTLTAANLSMPEQMVLKVLVSIGSDEQLMPAVDVLHDYYGVDIPRDILVGLLQDNLDLAMEVFTGGIRDTCQRELLIDALLRKINAPSWPRNGDGQEIFNSFISILSERLERVGGKLV